MAEFSLMGIVNVTPDSFSDGGRFDGPKSAIQHALQLEAEGASILDIGGESTRPGAAPVSVEEELSRVLPVIKGLKGKTKAAISIDTRKPQTAKAAFAAGAEIWNDVSALSYAPDSVQIAKELNATVILMHARGEPQTMQNAPHYEDVLKEVRDFFIARIKVCEQAGITKDKLILDPGIGFGKTLDHNIALMQNLHQFTNLGLPVLLGASRKRFIAALDREEQAQSRLGGSLAAVLAAATQGLRLFRVHDVAATRQALNVHFALDPAGNMPQQDVTNLP
jgi:dihydropteroate synthase